MSTDPQQANLAEFVAALEPAVIALGGSVVAIGDESPGDLPIEWHGEVACFLRTDELHGALARLVAHVEREIGAPLARMDRDQKQNAIARLEDQGAFLLRGSVEDVAAMMGVSRVTLYTYINAVSSS